MPICKVPSDQVSVSPEEIGDISRLMEIHWDFPSANTGYLTHNLHPYPAKFIPQIPSSIIQELSSPGETIADIFCGSGTTLLESLRLSRNAIGIDANPLAVLISRAKTTPLTTVDFQELATHKTACRQLRERLRPPVGDLFHSEEPFQSLGWRPSPDVCEFWFSPHVVEELAELRVLIDQLQTPVSRQFCGVAFAAIIVSVSNQDSDTRYVRRNKRLAPGDTVRRYLTQLTSSVQSAKEMSDLINRRFNCTVLDANLLETPKTEPFDLVVTSPPYPNAYSYHLYHRTRLIWLGYDPELFKKIEIGSHRKYSAKGSNRATPETFRGEFQKVFHWLRHHLRSRRYACFVIGDSTINGERIDNASILSETGFAAGFNEVARIKRTIAPTKKAFNPKIGRIKTESILILQKG